MLPLLSDVLFHVSKHMLFHCDWALAHFSWNVLQHLDIIFWGRWNVGVGLEGYHDHCRYCLWDYMKRLCIWNLMESKWDLVRLTDSRIVIVTSKPYIFYNSCQLIIIGIIWAAYYLKPSGNLCFVIDNL